MTLRQERLAWVVAVAAPLAWFFQLTVGWALVPPADQSGRVGALTAVSVVAFAVTVVAAITGAALVRERRNLLTIGALALGLAMMLLVACTALPIWLLGPGNEP